MAAHFTADVVIGKFDGTDAITLCVRVNRDEDDESGKPADRPIQGCEVTLHKKPLLCWLQRVTGEKGEQRFNCDGFAALNQYIDGLCQPFSAKLQRIRRLYYLRAVILKRCIHMSK